MVQISPNFRVNQSTFTEHMSRIGKIFKDDKLLSSHLEDGTKDNFLITILKDGLSLLPYVNLSRIKTKAVAKAFVQYAQKNRELLKQEKNYKSFTKKFLKYEEKVLIAVSHKTGNARQKQIKILEETEKKIEKFGKELALPSPFQKHPSPLKFAFDPVKIDLLKKDAESNSIAQRKLAHYYQHGIGMPKDLEKAFTLYTALADQGDPSCQVKIGGFYEQGIGISKDVQKAEEYYQKAADQQHIHAYHSLAKLYHSHSENNIKSRTLTASKMKAYEYMGKALEKGFKPNKELTIGIHYMLRLESEYLKANKYYLIEEIENKIKVFVTLLDTTNPDLVALKIAVRNKVVAVYSLIPLWKNIHPEPNAILAKIEDLVKEYRVWFDTTFKQKNLEEIVVEGLFAKYGILYNNYGNLEEWRS